MYPIVAGKLFLWNKG